MALKKSNEEKKEDDSLEIPDISEILKNNKETYIFRMYLNCLSSMSDFLKNKRRNPELLAKEIIKSNDYQELEYGKCNDMDKLGRAIRNAWLTEIQMYFSPKDDELFYTNHWLSIKAYYAIYFELLAFIMSSGRSYEESHKYNLDIISYKIKEKSDLFPLPWKAICSGNPEVRNPQLLNLPSNISMNWSSDMRSSNSSFWDIYVKFLRNTRRSDLDKVCKQWKKKNKKDRISPSEKRKKIDKLAPTSFFNCLYRLRVRANYKGVDIFLKETHSKDDAIKFKSALLNITWCTLFSLELLIAHCIGKSSFKSLATDFNKYDKKQYSKSLINRRWEIMDNVL